MIRQIVIEIDTGEDGDFDYAYDEIVGSIMDAQDSEELGGCEVDWWMPPEDQKVIPVPRGG